MNFFTRICVLILAVNSSIGAFGQSNVSSLNVVGYYNTVLYPGDNLIANQLNYYTGGQTNRINDILLQAPAGSTFTMWDPVAQALLPISVFDEGSWSINYQLSLGRGAILNTPSQVTNTFVGEVSPYSNLLPEFGGPIWQPNYTDGVYLLASPVPVGGSISNMFYMVTGRAPQEGENVRLLDATTQTYLTTTFHSLGGWDNGNPNLAVGQSAWFNLGPVSVPEPGVFALLSLAGVAAVFLRKART